MSFLQSQPSNPWTRQPIFRIPGVVAGLILLLVLAHVARSAMPDALSYQIINRFAFIPARYSHAFLAAHKYIDPGNLFDRAIPFVSYMALHNDYTHLAINCLWLLAFGPIVARRFGGLLFLGFFLICGLAAAATHLAFNWGSLTPVIGASGAISGLMGAGMRLLPTQAPWADTRRRRACADLLAPDRDLHGDLAGDQSGRRSHRIWPWAGRIGANRLAGPCGRLSGRPAAGGPVRPAASPGGRVTY